MLRRHTCFALFLILATACGPQERNYKLHELPDGSQIKLVGVSRAYFTEGEQALLLTYVTDIPLDDRARLAAEVDHIWQFFQVNVEKAGYTTGMIMANEPRPKGIIARYRTAGFAWRKDLAGFWQKVTPKDDAA